MIRPAAAALALLSRLGLLRRQLRGNNLRRPPPRHVDGPSNARAKVDVSLSVTIFHLLPRTL